MKRIGDEVLATFESVSQCEEFINAPQEDQILRDYEFKTAMDYGEVFFLKFGEPVEDDPYGPAVDRCARISKLAKAGVVICSAPYHDEVVAPAELYILLGPFKLPGIAQPQGVYVRQQQNVADAELYLKPLLDALNDSNLSIPHYHSIPRRFSTKDFKTPSNDKGRPFLLSELLNVPKLPLSLTEFLEILGTLKYEDEASKYVGYLVEWEGFYSSAEIGIFRDHLSVMVDSRQDRLSHMLALQMPIIMMEAMRSIDKGRAIRFRGIIMQILNARTPVLDYVDVEFPENVV